MESKTDKNRIRTGRKTRYRDKVDGLPVRPRLAVYRSLNHIYVQAIDDTTGATVASASSIDKEIRKTLKNGGNIAAAKSVGEVIAKRLKDKGLVEVVFDRGGYLYHGRVKALADAAREHGLKF
ncbi:MAG TPA: 50S ribosomal protein L18 [Patescibacteria group bacterium]|jgi:large subunit ribosomal protein L18|nr:50S ribosomal protein L18 [Patescibacteria group bacterium]